MGEMQENALLVAHSTDAWGAQKTNGQVEEKVTRFFFINQRIEKKPDHKRGERFAITN